ncbi:MAG: ABC transporter ATP-binding protein [Planctomycetes bacterium]|nr:ABC transporter ATP-binding protein [Planctomycetota bacterium]
MKKYKGQAVAIVLLGAVSAVGSKITLVLLKPLMGLLFQEDQEDLGNSILDHYVRDTLDPWLQQLDWFGWGPQVSSAVALMLAMIAVGAVFSVTHYFFLLISRMLGVRMITDLRQDLAEHVMSLDMRYHSGRSMGDLLSRITNDVGTSLRVLSILVEELIQDPFHIIALLVVAYAAAPTATIGMLVFLPLLAWPVIKLGPKVRTRSKLSQESLGDTTHSLMQILSGIRVVKSFRAEAREAARYRKANDEFLHQTKRMVRAQALTLGISSFLSQGGLGLIFGLMVLVSALFTPLFQSASSMMVFLVAIGTLFAHVKRVTKAISIVYSSSGAAVRVFDILDMQGGVPDSPQALSCAPLTDSIEFDQVVFDYGVGEGPAINGVSFTVKRGERIAFVGASGSGKSTLLDLVARFYDPTQGVVRIDGHNLRDLAKNDWLDQLAVVQQSPFLFQTTLRENIRYGRPDASDQEVLLAAKRANLDSFLAELPQGLETPVGDDGARLSGGQAQRVTIARALLKDAEVLLLDEATSALDSESEKNVQSALEELMRGRTVFCIAHRLSTIRSADRILVFDRGKIVEDGSHDALVELGGVYANLWALQAGS